jgi:hypothetical protein
MVFRRLARNRSLPRFASSEAAAAQSRRRDPSLSAGATIERRDTRPNSTQNDEHHFFRSELRYDPAADQPDNARTSPGMQLLCVSYKEPYQTTALSDGFLPAHF